MNELVRVVLQNEANAEPALPMDVVGWGVLIVSLLIAVAWLAYLYR